MCYLINPRFETSTVFDKYYPNLGLTSEKWTDKLTYKMSAVEMSHQSIIGRSYIEDLLKEVKQDIPSFTRG